ncbi:MAG TPA: 2'-5' RNA ligase family protein [Sphingomicrobium sp.]|nr:2'-5' RNA ligase family protein [Sphingomicrobium sp.]
MAGALIVLAELGEADFAWLDALRRQHYPAERNRVPAHLTLFRALPPSAEAEIRRSLARAAARAAPEAWTSGVIDLGQGVALRVSSPGLEQVRDELAGEFHGLLSAQDLGPWTAHVTVQNKVEVKAVRALLRRMRAEFEPRPLKIRGLQLVRYADGGWAPLAAWRFRA